MRIFKWLILLNSILLISLVICIYLKEINSYSEQRKQRINFISAEESKEHPYSRMRYLWLRLRDPATNSIPKNIHTREVAFVKNMIKDTDRKHFTLTDEWEKRGPYHIGGRTKALAIDVLDENVQMFY